MDHWRPRLRRQQSSPSIPLAPEPTRIEPVKLEPGRVAGYEFGTGFQVVRDVIRARLGEPTQIRDQPMCPLPEPGVGLARIVEWDGLLVEFVAVESTNPEDLVLTQWALAPRFGIPESVKLDPSLPMVATVEELIEMSQTPLDPAISVYPTGIFGTDLGNGVTYFWFDEEGAALLKITSGEIRWCWDA